MERTYVSDIKPGKECLVYGWVSEVRNLGSIKFILLRDKTGLIQVTAIKDKTKSEIFEQFSKLTKESVIEVRGNTINNILKFQGIFYKTKLYRSTASFNYFQRIRRRNRIISSNVF